jgi:hypothetical protein
LLLPNEPASCTRCSLHVQQAGVGGPHVRLLARAHATASLGSANARWGQRPGGGAAHSRARSPARYKL